MLGRRGIGPIGGARFVGPVGRTDSAVGVAEGPAGGLPAGATGFWLNTDSGTRHNRTCKYSENTAQGEACGADDGKACGICRG